MYACVVRVCLRRYGLYVCVCECLSMCCALVRMCECVYLFVCACVRMRVCMWTLNRLRVPACACLCRGYVCVYICV